MVVVLNFTPVERRWRCPLPLGGAWHEALNTDAARYGGGNRGNLGRVLAEPVPHRAEGHSAELVLPPLSTLFLIPEAHA